MLKDKFIKAAALLLALWLAAGMLLVPFATVPFGNPESGVAYAMDKSNEDPANPGHPKDPNAASEDSGTQHYMEIGIVDKLDPNKQQEGNIIADVIPQIQDLITKIFLPLAILLVSWRIVYLAIFPTLAQIDPLDMLSNARYSGTGGSGGRGTRGGKGSYDAARKALKLEVKGTLIGLIVVAVVWMLIQLALWAAVVILGAV